MNVSHIHKNYNTLYNVITTRNLQHLYLCAGIEYRTVGHWDIFENVHAVALKCKTKGEFKKKYPGARRGAERNEWYTEVTKHMVTRRSWTIEKVLSDSLKCKTKKEFEINFPTAYAAAKNNGWYDEVTAHMTIYILPKAHWDIFENVYTAALKCKTIGEFKHKQSGAFNGAKRNNWYVEVTSHLKRNKNKPHGHWDIFENVHTVALTCKSKEEFKKHYGAYGGARRNNWLNLVTSHIKPDKKPPGHWDIFENVQFVASLCKNNAEFVRKYGSAYNATVRNKQWPTLKFKKT